MNKISYISYIFCAAVFLLGSFPAFASEASQNLLRQGGAEFGSSRFAEALALFQQAATADPQDGEAHFLAGAALNRLGRHGEALESLQQAETLKITNQELYFELGWAQLFRRHYERAVKTLARYEQARPGRGLTQEFLGRAWLGLGQDAKARQAFREALKRDASLAPACNYYLGVIALRLGEREKGTALLEKLSRQQPGSAASSSARALLDAQQAQERPWGLALSAAGGYDSNVPQVDPDLPLPSGLGKRHAAFAQLSAAVAYDFLREPADRFSAGYELSTALYDGISEFNTLDERLTFLWRHRFSQKLALDAGLENRYANIGGDARSYDAALPLSLDVSVSDWAILRPSYTFLYSDNLLPVSAVLDRDGTGHVLGAQMFMNPKVSCPSCKTWARATWRLGLSHRWDDTDGGDYDLSSDTLGAGANWQLPEQVGLDVGYAHVFERYSNRNSFTGFTRKRRDDVDMARVELSKALDAQWSLWANYSYIRDDSNLATYDYTRQVGTAGVTFRY